MNRARKFRPPVEWHVTVAAWFLVAMTAGLAFLYIWGATHGG